MAFRSRVAVRGFGSDRSGAQTNGVGFFIDNVYQSGTSRFNAPFFDIERVEVLKGPQGARYGRNSMAGVVNVVTRRPDNELRANIQTSVENEDGIEYAGLVSGPIIQDRLYGKLAFAHNESDGDFRHANTGRNVLSTESDFLSGRLIFDASERLSFDLQVGISDSDGVAFAFSETSSLQNLDENFLIRDDQTSGADYDDYSLITSWAGDGFDVRNRLSYVNSLQHLGVDGDVTRFDGIFSKVDSRVEEFSTDIRIQSAGDGALTWMVGGEYYDADTSSDFPTFFLDEIDLALTGMRIPALRDALVSISPSTNTIVADTEVWSIYGEVGNEFFERLELVLSVRYDDIDKSVFNNAAGTTASGLGDDFRERSIQPLASVRYHLDEQSTVYASVAKGIREGGFNASALTKDFAVFDTDELVNYEIGLKHQFADGAGHINVSAFYSDADTMNQAAIIQTDAGNLANGAITLGGAEAVGIELDLRMQMTEHVVWSSAIGVLDCELVDVPAFADRSPDFQQVGPGIRNGAECQDSSEWTFSSSVDVAIPTGFQDWMAVGALSVSGKGETRLTSDQLLRADEEERDPLYLVDLTLGVQNRNWNVIGYVENLTDQRYAIDHFSAEGLCASGICGATGFITTLAPKRRYGLRLRYDL